MSVRKHPVKFVRWPSESLLRNYYKSRGMPCLLVVETGAQAPICTGPNEDWIRVPVSREDVESRVEALQRRMYTQTTPVIDSAGVLHYGERSIALSKVQVHLMDQFIEHYGEVVYRSELVQCLTEIVRSSTRNSLDLHVMRIRRRISPVGLQISTVRGSGYLLEPKKSTPFDRLHSESKAERAFSRS